MLFDDFFIFWRNGFGKQQVTPQTLMRGVLFERNIDFALAEADVCFGRVKISVIPNAQKSDVFLRQNKVNADVSLRNCQIVADHAPVDFGTIFVIRDETAQLVYVREF